MLGATTILEKAGVVGSTLASAYLGAIVGSLMVATDSTLAYGIGKRNANMSLAVAQWGARYGLYIHPFVMAGPAPAMHTSGIVAVCAAPARVAS
ncbi:hypothetical protein LGM65_31835 [Burkholderia anthina]|uniref:hypothetical protein n=1 Tax=Burkholderia anthina TaxID=179879 RepID=UPI001CF5AFAE|nr:hypothetical protein [Burkholderia anthina]MCA8095409.1 hypothetical protein [Burkholderia anthina]